MLVHFGSILSGTPINYINILININDIQPIAVAIHTGCGAEACLNWLFTFLFWIPGIPHSIQYDVYFVSVMLS